MSSTYTHFFKKVAAAQPDKNRDEMDQTEGSAFDQETNRSKALNAYIECEAIDEYNFQVQAALLSSKVLKLLEKDETSQSAALKLRHFSRTGTCTSFYSQGSSILASQQSPVSSGLFPTVARTRSSSWISSQSFKGITRSPAQSYTEGPLLDRILEKYNRDSPIATHEIIKMINLLTNLHSYCPETNSVGAPMGATCTVSDYTQVIASPEAMTRLVFLVRELIEEKAPTPLISSTVPVNGRLIVCGDTHAQLQDVLWVFFKNGVPSPSNVYVFNGDICDRGGHAVEIFLILFLFKLNHYNSVHIIRGNHEDDYCNIYYGFLTELKHKFGHIAGGTMHSEFLDLFYSLPLACLIDSWVGHYRCSVTGAVIDLSIPDDNHDSPKSATGVGGTEVVLRRKDATNGHRATVRGDQLIFEKRIALRSINSDGGNIVTWGSPADSWEYLSPRILVLHGGIPLPPNASSGSSVLLKHFKDLPHRMKIPPAPKTVLEQWMYQILWSDPAEMDGPRGRGTPFFAQHTKSFADSNNLAAVIRAHQVPANQRGVSFHHKQRLVTVFTASNYCGSSQNYGGVAIFTPSLFPSLALNRTLFEHWAPPLAIIRDVLAKHQNATQDVRIFIAHEIETERAPVERASIGALTNLEQKIGEYVTSLIVHEKRNLWESFNGRKKSLSSSVIALPDWIEVCNHAIGHHFPWPAIIAQLDIDLIENNHAIDFTGFLNRFKASLRFGEPLVDTWESAVVRGFFHELISRDKLFQSALLEAASAISPAELAELIRKISPSISQAQAQIVCQAIQECSPGKPLIETATIFQIMAEYIRSYFSLIDAAPDSVHSEMVVEIGRDSIEFFSKLRSLILNKIGGGGESRSGGDPIIAFFKHVMADNAAELKVPLMSGIKRLEAFLREQGLDDLAVKVSDCLSFITSEENEIIGPSSLEEVSELTLMRFYAACYLDGTPVGTAVKNRIAEHSLASIYFHRNALRCACVHLDKGRCGQIDRLSFQRALLALNGSLDPEWTMSRHQVRCAIEYLRWQEFAAMTDSLISKSVEELDKSLVIEYDVFLEYV